MDAIKFINEKFRMCNFFHIRHTCNGCPLNEFNGCDVDDLAEHGDVEKAVEAVEKWSNENPSKTRQSVFLQQYPNVATYKGVIGIRPCQLEEGYTSQYCLCDSSQCVQCRKEYWFHEVD